jgi:hypothetical protein
MLRSLARPVPVNTTNEVKYYCINVDNGRVDNSKYLTFVLTRQLFHERRWLNDRATKRGEQKESVTWTLKTSMPELGNR